MTDQLKAKLERAQEAVREVFTDRSGRASENVEALEVINADLNEYLEALDDDDEY